MVQYQCPKCHSQFTTANPVNSVRCPYCGNEFQVIAGQQNQQQPPQFGQQQQYYGQPQPNMAYGPGDIGVFDSGPSGKSRGVAGLLAILLGGLGIHYFYVGKAGGGLLCILLTMVTCGAWSILTLIQGILMMTMRSEEFERKYVYSTSTMPLF
ncbi:MAG: NINE protein [Muribaculaceae bacterium]|nr:NINE protein [Muribaculaceae bacterium]